MHLLATEPGTIADGSAAVDLAQTPGRHRRAGERRHRDRLLAAAQARRRGADPPRRACASRRSCGSATISRSISIWRWSPRRGWSSRGCSAAAAIGPTASSGWSRPAASAASRWRCCPATTSPTPSWPSVRPLPPDACRRLWRYLAEGGPGNADNFLRYAAALIGARRPTGPSRRRCCAPGSIGRSSATAEPCRHRRRLARRWRRRADRVLPGAGAVGEHRAGRCAGRGARRAAAQAAAGLCPEPQGRRGGRADRRTPSPRIRRR